MDEEKAVTAARVPATVTVAVQVGRPGPQAAAGRLRVHRLPGTATVAVHAAREGGPGGAGERRWAGLYLVTPGAPGRGEAPRPSGDCREREAG